MPVIISSKMSTFPAQVPDLTLFNRAFALTPFASAIARSTSFHQKAP